MCIYKYVLYFMYFFPPRIYLHFLSPAIRQERKLAYAIMVVPIQSWENDLRKNLAVRSSLAFDMSRKLSKYGFVKGNLFYSQLRYRNEETSIKSAFNLAILSVHSRLDAGKLQHGQQEKYQPVDKFCTIRKC